MRWDSPFVLAAAGTLAIHLVLLVMVDAIVIYTPDPTITPTPRIEMVEIEVPPIITPEPPPPIPPPEPVKQPDPPPQPKIAAKVQDRAPRAAEPPLTKTEPPLAADPNGIPGGEQVVTLDAAQTGGVGVPVAVGKRTSERVGRGGQGGGTGAGSGSGVGEIAKPMSVATIKKRALPRGDYGYFDAGKDYPTEARQLGIEGAIRVRLVVNEKGKVVAKVLLNKLGHGLDELALERASRIEFEPAFDTDDRAVTSVVIWTFNMTLPK
ncbi:MAG: TonB family protein [Deltaproteobacteria bacterium]|nr:TonB family protein [Deltaproteobacteria bacterium]